MSTTFGNEGVRAVYDAWLAMLPQFLAQFGASVPAGAANAAEATSLPFPADQVARAAALTQQALQSLSQSYAPMLEAGGAPALLHQWAATSMPLFAGMLQPAATAGATPAVPANPWLAAFPFPTTLTSGSVQGAVGAAMLPFQQMQQAWMDLGTQMTSGSQDAYLTAFDRTFGALADALGLGPMRKMHSAARELMQASLEQNQARTRYALLVQQTFASGLGKLHLRLAEMSKAGERIDSVLALLRLWATCTEQAVHEALQSDDGLTATAAVARAGLAHRKKLQRVAAIVADSLDMATRRDLDEAFREIQQLKRELRKLRAPVVIRAANKPARSRAAKGKAE